MRVRNYISPYFFILFLISNSILSSIEFENNGLISSWLNHSKYEGSYIQLGIRFLPSISVSHTLSSTKSIEAEISFNTYGTSAYHSSEELNFMGEIKPYRLTLKYSSPRFEAKIGLQKISFGSASLLRPLMWFDRLDPRDPIQLTDGVYSLLLRSFISEKTNLWLWILYKNKETKGLEISPTERDSPEMGFRAQIPAGKGELAFSFHHRKAVFLEEALPENHYLNPLISKENFSFLEERYAMDGKWDIGIGLWFETAFTHQRNSIFIYPWQRSFTAGMDYTFPIGNGLHFLAEYYLGDSSKKIFSRDVSSFSSRFLALSISYSFSLLDDISSIIFCDERNKDFYSFLRWQRTYDRWSINLMVFSNPEKFPIYRKTDDNFLAGKGFLLMVIYNY